MATHSSILAWRIPQMRSLAGYSLWGHKESDTTERLSTHTHNNNKVYNKRNMLESSPNHLPTTSPWKNCLPENWSLVPKRLGTYEQNLLV